MVWQPIWFPVPVLETSDWGHPMVSGIHHLASWWNSEIHSHRLKSYYADAQQPTVMSCLWNPDKRWPLMKTTRNTVFIMHSFSNIRDFGFLYNMTQMWQDVKIWLKIRVNHQIFEFATFASLNTESWDFSYNVHQGGDLWIFWTTTVMNLTLSWANWSWILLFIYDHHGYTRWWILFPSLHKSFLYNKKW